MTLAGAIYYAGAMLKGAEWRQYLREIRSGAPDELSSRWLGETLRHAVALVPYYEWLGLSPEADVASFPLLTRRLVRERFSDLQSRDPRERIGMRTSTGGSTGEPVWILRDRASLRWDYATDLYYFGTLLGIPAFEYLSHPRLFLWHRRARRRGVSELAAKLLGQCTYLEPYTICSDETLRGYVATLARVRPAVIWAFAGPLYELARYAKRENLRLPRPRFILSSVEMLYPAMRETIEEAFGCPVYDYYGAAEVGRVAAECKQHRFHVFSFNNHVELLGAANRPVGSGEEGRLVITPLHNRAMSLVRYDIGDMARASEGDCPCGCPLPVLDQITGRVTERFVTTDGKTVYGGYFIAMFYEQDWISEFQVLQQDVDLIRIYYKRTPEREVPPQALGQLDSVVRKVMGADCRIEWQEVEAVPRTPIGKHLYVRSLVWEERLNREP